MKDLKRIFKVVSTGLILVIILILILLLIKFSPFKGLSKKWELKSLYKKALSEEKKGNIYGAVEYLEKINESFGKDKKVYTALLKLASLYEKMERLLEAKKLLEKIISDANTNQIIEEAQRNLGNINIKILFSSIVTDDDFIYEVKEGDSLIKIAQRFNTTPELIKISNKLKTDSLRTGMRLKITKLKFSVLVDKSQNTLTLKADEKVLKVYTVSTGLNNVTPVGTFKIVNKVVNPTWYKEGRVIPPGDPENILGSHWLGLSQPGYGIHGTTQPETIGKHITQGCIRMYNQDVEELYTILPVGTEVTIVE